MLVAWRMRALIIAGSLLLPAIAQMPAGLKTSIDKTCLGCHSGTAPKGGLDFASLSFDLGNRVTRERWVRVHDRIEKGEMPPKGVEFAAAGRTAMLGQLAPLLHAADLADVAKNGRGPMRRLNRDEYEEDLRDILRLPHLDIRDMLPEDREAHHFNKVSETLDMSRVQLAAYLDASEAALRQAMATSPVPPAVTTFRASGTNLFPGFRSTGTIRAGRAESGHGRRSLSGGHGLTERRFGGVQVSRQLHARHVERLRDFVEMMSLAILRGAYPECRGAEAAGCPSDFCSYSVAIQASHGAAAVPCHVDELGRVKAKAPVAATSQCGPRQRSPRPWVASHLSRCDRELAPRRFTRNQVAELKAQRREVEGGFQGGAGMAAQARLVDRRLQA